MTELLVVLAILVIIAGVLFPVFNSAKAAATKTQCLGNFKQVGYASGMYSIDYDDYFPPVNHQPAETPNSRNDRTWVQLLLPYIKSFRSFQCPGDSSNRTRPESTFDSDLVPGDLYSQYYTASLHTNVGYNFQYLAPIMKVGGQWMSLPKSLSSIVDVSRTIEFVDSVWGQVKGTPTGGGSWLVSPPCRYEIVNGTRIDTFVAFDSRVSAGGNTPPEIEVYTPIKGWDPALVASDVAYGGAWPWHMGRMNLSAVDGSARSVSIGQLSDGCDVRPRWQGAIYDQGRYVWLSR